VAKTVRTIRGCWLYSSSVADGRLMLDNGSSASCRYTLAPDGRGTLQLPPAFFTPHGATTDGATLELADGTRRRVRVTFGPRVDEASFTFNDEEH
jgi:hypothetical protein